VFSPKKLIVIMAIIAMFAVPTVASAGNGSVKLDAPKVSVNYDSCYNGTTPLPCWSVNFTISNKTTNDMNCIVVSANDALVVYDYVVPAGTSTYGGGFVKGYVPDQKYLTLNLSCYSGTNAYTDSQRVRVGGI
jgi:hypothetical protein